MSKCLCRWVLHGSNATAGAINGMGEEYFSRLDSTHMEATGLAAAVMHSSMSCSSLDAMALLTSMICAHECMNTGTACRYQQLCRSNMKGRTDPVPAPAVEGIYTADH